MAKCIVDKDSDFSAQMEKLGEVPDKAAAEVLRAGAEVVRAAVIQSLKSVIGRDLKEKERSSGQLLSSFGISPVRAGTDFDYDIKVGVRPERAANVYRKKRGGKSKPLTNGALAGILEHGKVGQAPRPFMKPAEIASKDEAIKAMEAKLIELSGGAFEHIGGSGE